jgi:hypothetical protein
MNTTISNRRWESIGAKNKGVTIQLDFVVCKHVDLPSVIFVLDKKESNPHSASLLTLTNSSFLSNSTFLVNVRSAIPQVWPASRYKKDYTILEMIYNQLR